MTRVTLRAHAKINLNLKVIRKRPDDYHDIDTVVQTISLHDTLVLEPRPEGIVLEVDDPALPAGPSNLVWQAAESLLAAGVVGRRGVRMSLAKRIPVGAGLGGGSSDAAAALVGLDRLWGLGIPTADLRNLAAGLGSDVPFFLSGGTARLAGRGTEIEPLPDLPTRPLVVVFPGAPVSTREVYAGIHVPLTPPPETVSIVRFGPGSSGSIEGWMRAGNDLERSACKFCPAISEIKERLLSAGALAAAMTGSGSAVFGAFGGEEAAADAARGMARPGWCVMRCSPVSRAEHLKSIGLA